MHNNKTLCFCFDLWCKLRHTLENTFLKPGVGKRQIAVSVSNGDAMLFCNNDFILLSDGGGGKKGLDCIEYVMTESSIGSERLKNSDHTQCMAP